MKTEIFIALIFGTFLGLAGMMVIVKIASPSPSSKSVQTTPEPGPQATIGVVENKLISPLPTTSWDTTSIPFKGTVKNGSFVFFVTDTTDTILPVTNNQFQTTVASGTGINSYALFSSNAEKIGESLVARFSNVPLNKPLRFASVTDITAESIQVKAEKGTIEQVAFAPNIVAANLVKDPKKVVTSDVAIGDRVILAIDDPSKNDVLALAIFVIPSDYSQRKYSVTKGEITKIEKQTVTLSTPKGDLVVSLDSATKLFGIKEDGTTRKRTKLIASDTGKTVYVTTEDSKTTIRSIFISE